MLYKVTVWEYPTTMPVIKFASYGVSFSEIEEFASNTYQCEVKQNKWSKTINKCIYNKIKCLEVKTNYKKE